MNPNAQNWGRIPSELKAQKRWCVCGPSLDPERPKAPQTVTASGHYRASPTNPKDWVDFETAANYAYKFTDAHIGYVLQQGDGLTCIDMDVKNAFNCPDKPNEWTSQDALNRMWAIVQRFECYTEKSRSGYGLHIWVKGEVGPGRKRDGIEMYSQERFIICTGEIVLQQPIRELQQWLEELYIQLQPKVVGGMVELVEVEPEFPDSYIWTKLRQGGNAEKFTQLCECTSSYGEAERKVQGSYINLGYPSQSEADLALMSMFTFYSKSNEQCRRMFRQTGLGQRAKAQHNNRHLDLMLRIIRARQMRESENMLRAEDAAQAMIAIYREQQGEPEILPPEQLAPNVPENIAAFINELQSGKFNTAHDRMAASALAAAPVATAMGTPPSAPDGQLNWPPGFAGAIAGYIYQSSPRPVREVAIVATLGLLAGICGKAFGIPGSGLNLYLILVGRSAIGKEAMHSGISSIMQAVRESTPAAQNFVDFTEFASGPALQKACAQNQSFCNVTGEWGRRLKRLAVEDGREGPMAQLRTVMTNLYQKSGPSSTVGGIGYSNKENNIASVNGVAYSMIGETTPGTYYEALTESMMEDGFMSRFTIIEYDGNRPPLNHHALKQPDRSLTEALCGLCVHSLTLLSRFQTQQVSFDQASSQLMYEFDLECDNQINSTDVESWRQMWNRAHLKALRLSALLAAADNWLNPVVTKDHATWALDVIRRDIAMTQRRMENGDVGTGDSAREKKILSFFKDYLRKLPADSYGVTQAIWDAGIVPRKYLQIRCSRVTAFTNHKLGATRALEDTLRTMVANGYIIEVPKDKIIESFGFQGVCYRFVNN